MSAVVRPADVPQMVEPGNHLLLRALVTAAHHGGDVSVTEVRLAGHHRRLHTDRSTRVYAVLDGSLRLQAGDDPVETLTSGDIAVIERGRGYELDGTAVYLVVNAPAFIEGDDVYEDRR